ncbi:MAG: redox-sensitive bicupin YhaK (pirin superfamily) [Kiritimatiellia bacterium]|jgi:redox-sensitive bicupin YhaK (pirin superfamily)
MRTIKQVLSVQRGHWVGDGFPVRSMFAERSFTRAISPFLMMDYGGPVKFDPTTQRRGVGQHPHKGFETVTIVYSGGVEHADSVGNRGEIGPGDVQWMTAAKGIVHEEFHSTEFARTGGEFEMIQLWVNLPAKDKLVDPAYQAINDADIPVVDLPGGGVRVRVIAGDFGGVRGAASTFTPINLWDLKIMRGRDVDLDVPDGHNALLFVMHGGVEVSGRTLGRGELAIFEASGGSFQVHATDDTVAILLSGVPIDEPIAARGPFVMNTTAELRQAMSEYQTGQMGSISR